MLKLLSDENIPLLVFSAGVGDVIEQAFLQRYQFTNNMHIIANWMEFSHEVNQLDSTYSMLLYNIYG